MKHSCLSLALPFFICIATFSSTCFGEDQEALKVGFIGSLSSFAASYGTEVLEGAKLAVEEINADGEKIKLLVEDDQSVAKNTVTAYTKLHSSDEVDAIIGGTWWANSISKKAEADKVLLMSCETLYNKGYVKADSYFSLAGDLRDWVTVFGPLVDKQGYQTGAMVKFTSGFADTIAEEMGKLFSKDDRKYLGSVEYNDIQMTDAGTIAAKVKLLGPDVLYVDAQPSSLPSFIRRLEELELKKVSIFANSIIDDALKQNIINPDTLSIPIYFTRRESHTPEFEKKFEKRYGRKPLLHADLGYYAVYLVAKALEASDPIAAVKDGSIRVGDLTFTFDENNVWRGIPRHIWSVKDGEVTEIY